MKKAQYQTNCDDRKISSTKLTPIYASLGWGLCLHKIFRKKKEQKKTKLKLGD